MIRKQFPLGQSYTKQELELFVQVYNDQCRVRARNPWNQAYFLSPESQIIDDQVKGTPIEQAAKILGCQVGFDRFDIRKTEKMLNLLNIGKEQKLEIMSKFEGSNNGHCLTIAERR